MKGKELFAQIERDFYTVAQAAHLMKVKEEVLLLWRNVGVLETHSLGTEIYIEKTVVQGIRRFHQARPDETEPHPVEPDSVEGPASP